GLDPQVGAALVLLPLPQRERVPVDAPENDDRRVPVGSERRVAGSAADEEREAVASDGVGAGGPPAGRALDQRYALGALVGDGKRLRAGDEARRAPVDEPVGLLLGLGDVDEPRADDLGWRRRRNPFRNGYLLPGFDGQKRWTARVEAARSRLCLGGLWEPLERERVPVGAPEDDNRGITRSTERRVAGR